MSIPGLAALDIALGAIGEAIAAAQRAAAEIEALKADLTARPQVEGSASDAEDAATRTATTVKVTITPPMVVVPTSRDGQP